MKDPIHFWLLGDLQHLDPATAAQIAAAQARLAGQLPLGLRDLLAVQNGGVPRRRLFVRRHASPLLVDQMLALEAMEPAPFEVGGHVFATSEQGQFVMRHGRVLHVEGERVEDLGVSVDEFLERLTYEDTRWLVGIRSPEEPHALVEALRHATGGIFQKESEDEEGFRARHGSLADIENRSRHARLYVYPNRGDYPEASQCPWILEACIRPEDSEQFLMALRLDAGLRVELIHRPPVEALEGVLDRAEVEEAPLAPPPGSVGAAQGPAPLPTPGPQPSGKGDRFERGFARLKAIHGDHGLGVMKSLEPICPDMARFIIEFPFGDIYTRPGLDAKSRQIATMASLVTLGHATSELKSHIRGSLNIGITRTEIVELILQMSVYAGFPAAITGMRAAQQVFEELDEEARRGR